MVETGSSPVGGHAGADAGTGHAGDGDIAAELARARERLAFYESFDELIQHNVQQSGELLRRVAAEQEQTEQRLRAMQAEVDHRLNEQRSVLEQIARGMDGLRTNLDTIASQVSASLSSLPQPATSTPSPIGAGDVPVLPDFGRASEPKLAGAPSAGVRTQPGISSASASDVATASPPVTGDVPAVGATGDQRRAAALQELGVPGLVEAPGGPPARPRKIDLIIHGVPNAATALSLQRHLQGVPSVESVEVREYVSGVLRFQVLGSSFGANDLRGWPGGGGLELVTAREHVLELKLPTAEGF